MIRKIVKHCVNGVFLAAAWPAAVLSAFGRIKPVYTFFAQASANVPGGIGDRLRVAYYCLTLAECHMSSRHLLRHLLCAPGSASRRPRLHW